MENLLIEAENFVINLLNEELDSSFVYHNVFHTQRVVEKTKELIEGMQIDEKSAQVLTLTAWFHDVGYTKSIEGHEEESVKIAEEFFKSKNVSEDVIKQVSELILATRMGVKPSSNLEKIIRDADMDNLWRKDFFEKSHSLKKEIEIIKNIKIRDPEWNHWLIELLKEHKFEALTQKMERDWIKHENLMRMLEELENEEI